MPDRARCRRATDVARAASACCRWKSFITGYRKTALAAGEVIAAVRIPFLAPGRSFPPTNSPSASTRTFRPSSPPSASNATAANRGIARAAFGGMAARAMRARRARSRRQGRPWEPAWLPDVEPLLARDFTPIGDHARRRRLSPARGGRTSCAASSSRRSLERAGAGGGAMNEPLARAAAAVHAAVAPRQRGRTRHRRRALSRRLSRPCRARCEAALVLSPHRACPHLPHRFVARAAPRPASSRRSRPPTFPARTTSRPIRSDEPLIGRRRSSNTTASRSRPSPRPRSIRRARPPGWSRSSIEPLPAILTIEEAIARESFVSPPQTMVRGEVEPALAGAPHRLSGECAAAARIISISKGRSRSRCRAKTATSTSWRSTQHPTEVQHGRRASARPAVQRRHRRGAADGRRRSAARRARRPSSPASPPCSPARRGGR